MSDIDYGDTKKVRLLPEQTLFSQGDEGDKAYLIVQGILDVIVDDKKVGYMSDGELFGEMALILNQRRSATIICKQASELIEITRDKFNELINSASSEVKNLISELCTELSKRNSKNNYSKSDIENKLKDQNSTVCAITRQIFFRLSKSTSHIE